MVQPARDKTMFCRTCRYALNALYSPTGQFLRYTHGHSKDHRETHTIDPVPLAEFPDAIQKCDFCAQPPAVFIYLADDQFMTADRVVGTVRSAQDYHKRHNAARIQRLITNPDESVISAFSERWSACEPCAALVDKRDINALVSRVTDHFPAKLTKPNKIAGTRARMFAQYTGLFATMAPVRGRITREAPTGVWEEHNVVQS